MRAGWRGCGGQQRATPGEGVAERKLAFLSWHRAGLLLLTGSLELS